MNQETAQMQANVIVEEVPSAPFTSDARIPSRDRVVSRDLLDRWAR